MPERRIAVMGSFITDLAFRTAALPVWGQTILGSGFLIGPGGKGSNQAVAAARLGARVSFISKLGRDAFADLARRTWQEEKIDARFVFETRERPTGAASIVVNETSGDNAIVVVPGSGLLLTTAEVDQAREAIAESAVFLTQLESPLEAVLHALQLARSLDVTTILNPAPGLRLPDAIYPLCDYLTPNESEAATLVGAPVTSLAEAQRAASALLGRGARAVIVTLGSNGALVKTASVTQHVPACDAGPAIEQSMLANSLRQGMHSGGGDGKSPGADGRGCSLRRLAHHSRGAIDREVGARLNHAGRNRGHNCDH